MDYGNYNKKAVGAFKKKEDNSQPYTMTDADIAARNELTAKLQYGRMHDTPEKQAYAKMGIKLYDDHMDALPPKSVNQAYAARKQRERELNAPPSAAQQIATQGYVKGFNYDNALKGAKLSLKRAEALDLKQPPPAPTFEGNAGLGVMRVAKATNVDRVRSEIAGLKQQKWYADANDLIKRNTDAKALVDNIVAGSDMVRRGAETLFPATGYLTGPLVRLVKGGVTGEAQKRLEAMGYSPEEIEQMAQMRAIQIHGEQAAKSNKTISELSKKAPVIMSVASVPVNVLTGGVKALDAIMQSLGKRLGVVNKQQPIDYYKHPYLADAAPTVRQTVSGVLEDKTKATIMGRNLASSLYNLGMSMADSVSVAATAPWGVVLLGGAAASQAMTDALERGATDEQAMRMGIWSGVFEAAFEYISIDKLVSPKLAVNLAGNVKNALVQAGVEASEEGMTKLATTIADRAIMKDKSEYNTSVERHKAEGMSEGEATKAARREFLNDLAWDILGGAASGGLMSAGYQSGSNLMQDYALGKGAAEETVINYGKISGGESAKAAERLEQMKNNRLARAFRPAAAGKVIRLARAETQLRFEGRVADAMAAQGAEKGKAKRLAPAVASVIQQNGVSEMALNGIVHNDAAIAVIAAETGITLNTLSVPELRVILKRIADKRGITVYHPGSTLGAEPASEAETTAPETTAPETTAPETTGEREAAKPPVGAVEFADGTWVTEREYFAHEGDTEETRRAWANLKATPKAMRTAFTRADFASGPHAAEFRVVGRRRLTPEDEAKRIVNNLQEGEEHGDNVPNRTERDNGEGAGEQTEQLDRSGTRETAERSGERSGAESGQENIPGLGAERLNSAQLVAADKEGGVSGQELGIPSATDSKTLELIFPDDYTDEMQANANMVKAELGATVHYVRGSIECRADNGKTFYARGVLSQDGMTIWVQVDDRGATFEQITQHEMYHAYSRLDDSLNNKAEAEILRHYKGREDEYYATMQGYIDAYKGVIDIPANATYAVRKAAENEIREEMLADAYAGISAYGEHAEKYRSVVRQTVGQKADEAVENSTGPPPETENFSLRQDPNVLWGNTDITYDNKHAPIRFVWAVVPMNKLVKSHDSGGKINEAYPPELQPRDRTREASRRAVQRMARRLNPDELAESKTAANGAPIIRGDGVVISGNGRVAAIEDAYGFTHRHEGAHENENNVWKGDIWNVGTRYQGYLEEKAHRFGIEGDLPEHPVLVRVMLDDSADWAETARALNEATTHTYSATEQAYADSERMGEDIMRHLSVHDDGNLNTADNRDFIEAFVNRVVPDSEREDTLSKDGSFSQNGLLRAKYAVFAKAYKDPTLVDRLGEDPDNDIKNVTNALLTIAPKVLGMDMRAAGGRAFLSMRDDIIEAVRILVEARNAARQHHLAGRPVLVWAAQLQLFDDTSNLFSRRIANFFEINKASGKKIRIGLNAICDAIAEFGDPTQPESLIDGVAFGVGKTADELKEAALARSDAIFQEEYGRPSGLMDDPTNGETVTWAKEESDEASDEKSDAAQELSRGVTVSGSLADTTSAASTESISRNTEERKPKFSMDEDADLPAERDEEDLKERQFAIIQESNPADDDYHTWIRSAEQIKTFQEALADEEWADYDSFDPDYTREMADAAVESGRIQVYSSHPIERGVFVTPSLMEAESYAGGGQIHSKTVRLTDVAWIDPTQGQYAPAPVRYSVDEDSQGRELTETGKYSPAEDLYSLKQDSEGTTLTAAQQEYFKDSKVRVDDDGDYWYGEGRLLPVYHATYDKFTVFDRRKLGKITDVNASDEYLAATAHVGFWFNTQPLNETANLGTRSEKVYLNIKKPYDAGTLDGLVSAIADVFGGDVESLGENAPGAMGEAFADYLLQCGYDGVVLRDGEFGGLSFAALDPEQIKRTDNRNPTGNPDIRYSLKRTGDIQRDMRAPEEGNDPTKDLKNNTFPEGSFERKVQNIMTDALKEGTLDDAVEAVAGWLNTAEGKQKRAESRNEAVRRAFRVKKTADNGPKLEALIKKYGKIPKGTNAAREIEYPQKTGGHKHARRHLRTEAEAAVTPGYAAEEITDFVLNDEAATYVPLRNADAIAYAKHTIKTAGYKEALKRWQGIAAPDRLPTPNDIALGELLASEAAKVGDMDTAMQIYADVAVMGTATAQAVQAMSIVKKMGPTGELYYLMRVVDRLNAQYAEPISRGKMQAFKIDSGLAKEFLRSGTAEEAQAVMDKLLDSLAAQVPKSALDMWNAWRYLAMLGNPRTHIRNIFGNSIFIPARFIKNAMAAALEKVLVPVEQRTKTMTGLNRYKEIAQNDFDANADELTGTGKYNPADIIRDRRNVFHSNFLNWLSKFNTRWLEKEDMWFLRPAYVRAMSGFLAARNADPESLYTIEGRKLMNEARAYASEEALKATYRDYSATAAQLNKAAKNKYLGVVVEGLFPFKKTPLNILKRGVEYSPMGLATSLIKAMYQIKNGKMTPAQAIDKISAGMSGTMIAMLGMFLASLGMIHGGASEDKKKSWFDRMQGVQDYSLTIGGKNFTIDWMAPVSLPFFAGVEIWRAVNEEQSHTLKEVLETFMQIAEPMFSLSMLDGLRRTIKSAGYDENPLSAVIAGTLTSYAGQGIPTLFGQVARTVDPVRRATYVDKNKGTPDVLSRFWQTSVLGKTPGASKKRMAYVDAWGRKETEGSILWRAVENMLSPAYIQNVQTGPVEDELTRLAKETGDSGVFPPKAAKKFTVGGESTDLTAEQYENLSTLQGQTANRLVTDLINGPAYDNMTDAEKAAAVKEIYKYAEQTAKAQVFPDYNAQKWAATISKMNTTDPIEAITSRVLVSAGKYEDATEAAIAASWLSNDERRDLLVSTYYADTAITDPSRAKWEYVLTEENQDRETEIYSELFEKAYERLTASTIYQRANAEKQTQLMADMMRDVRADTRKKLAFELKKEGVRSTAKN